MPESGARPHAPSLATCSGHAVGVIGGTFDPIHFGHLRLAEEMTAALGLRRVLFVPAGQPPHRAAPCAPAARRLEMVRLAVAGNPHFAVDDREVRRAQPSYTVDTLAALRDELGAQQPLWLLLGADAFLGLPGWHQWRRLFELAHLAVAERPGASLLEAGAMPAELAQAVRQRATAPAQAPAGAVLIRSTTPLAISASVIRATLAARGSVRYLLPDAVLDYIHQHRLYPPQ